jgi:hypothetical protein
MRILKLQHDDFGFRGEKVSLNIHQKIALSFSVVTFLLLMYEEIFHLLAEFFHVMFESIENILDILIEHFLETSTHETQVIVFYILVPLIFLTLFQVYCWLPRLYRVLKRHLHRQKIETLAQWHVLPLTVKLEWWLFFISFFSCLIFFSF